MKTHETKSYFCKRTIRQLLTACLSAALFVAGTIFPSYAGTLENSTFYQGTMNLLQDLSLAVSIFGPLVCIICAGVFLARRSLADEQDGKLWTKRIVTSLVCAVLIGLVAGIVALITSYF